MAILNDYLNIIASSIPTYNTLPIAQIIQQVNLARKRIAQWTGCTRTITTFPLTAGTATYSFATIFSKTPLAIIDVQVWFGNTKYPIKRIRVDDYFYPQSSYPQCYWLTGSSITFYPTPAQTYNIDFVYYYEPVALVNTTDIDNDIPDVYKDATGYLSASLTALLDSNFQLSQAYQQMAQSVVNETNKNYL